MMQSGSITSWQIVGERVKIVADFIFLDSKIIAACDWSSDVCSSDLKTKIMASSPITSWQIDGETMETVADFIFLDSKITMDGDCSHEIKRCLINYDKPRQCIKKQRHHFADKCPYSQTYGSSSSHVWMLELDHKGG